MNAEHSQPPVKQPDEIKELKVFIDKYGKQILIATTAILIAVLAGNWVKINRNKNLRMASAKLGTAASIPELEAVVADYEATPAASLALLRLARAYSDSGNFIQAIAKYDDFIKKYPAHEFALGAKLGRIQCVEATGRVNEALDSYTEFANKNPGSHLASEAIFGRARCLELQGRMSEARTVYEDFKVANPESAWASRIDDRLANLERQSVEKPDVAASSITDLKPVVSE